MKLVENIKSYDKYDFYNMILEYFKGELTFKNTNRKISNLSFGDDGALKITIYTKKDDHDDWASFKFFKGKLSSEEFSKEYINTYVEVLDELLFALPYFCENK